MKNRAILKVIVLTLLAASGRAAAALPEIAHVQPDYMGLHYDLRQNGYRAGVLRHTPQIITGENFDATGLQIRVWDPGGDEKSLTEALSKRPRGGEPALPAEPPKEAWKIDPLDVERQVLVAPLNHWSRRPAVLWVGSAEGFSRPCLFNVAKPFWINEEKLAPGELLRIFGLGLKQMYRDNYIALKKGSEVRLLKQYDTPFYISLDTRLLEVSLPTDTPAGSWEVYVHNGWGGEYGWRKAGDLQVVPPVKKEDKIFEARAYGALGDGRADDTAALQAALAAAEKAIGPAAGSGQAAIVYLAPGTYRVSQSLRLSPGVSLRGAGRENTIIEGVGYAPASAGGRRLWNAALDIPASVLLLESNTSLQKLAVRGSVARGGGGYALVQTVTPTEEMAFPRGAAVRRVTLDEVTLDAPSYHTDHGSPGPLFYAAAFSSGPTYAQAESEYIKVIGSSIRGMITLGTARRADIIGNRISGGSIEASRFLDSFLGENIMEDDPYRFYCYRTQRSYFRSNEIHGFGNRRVAGASESFMIHGGSEKEGGRPTAAGPQTLTDASRNWKPGQFASGEIMVLITAGRGFGQYRRVTANSKDTLTVSEPWRVQPDASSEYIVGGFSADSVYHDNFNDGLGRMTLWLDCVNIVVEEHRDNAAGGIDIWGSDRSTAKAPAGFHPSWYNLLLGNSLEGSRIYQQAAESADNVWSGPVMFGNYIVGNNIVRPVHRNVRESAWPTAAIDAGTMMNQGRDIEPTTGRVQYTVIMNNNIVGADVGIRVPQGVRKTFLLRNDFTEVRRPIVDAGSGTVIGAANRERFLSDDSGRLSEKLIADQKKPDPLADKARPPWSAPAASTSADRPFMREAGELRRLIPSMAYLRQDVENAAKEAACRENLKRLFQALRDYERKNGSLPEAVFYPENPLQDADSLQVLLGRGASALFRCPSAGPDLDALGWSNYIWNAECSGKKLADIKAPGETWLMMDFTGVHSWLVAQKYAGHRGGINVLFADGSVRRLTAEEAKGKFYFVN